MPTAHGRVQYSQLEEPVERLAASQPGLGDLPRAAPEQRLKGPLNDPVDHVLGGEVRARLVPARGGHEHEHPVALLEPPVEQALVERSEVPDRQIPVVHLLPRHPVEAVERRGENAIRNRPIPEVRVPLRREQPAVVLGHTEGIVTPVHDSKQGAQVVVQVIRRSGEHPSSTDRFSQGLPLRPEAVLAVVRVVERQEAARLGVQTEEQSVQQYERVVEGVCQHLARTLLLLREQPLSNERHRGEDLAL